MKSYIVLLRGIMPGGKNKVPMSELREILKADGFEKVSTYIQSGNVLLSTSMPEKKIKDKVHNLIKENIGAEIEVVVSTSSKLKKILEGNPFKDEDIYRVFFCIFGSKPAAAKIKKVSDMDFYPENLVINKDSAYMFIPGNAARSKLSNNFLEKNLDISATTRNFNTLSKLIELGK